MAEPGEGRVAVYIDFDNIVISRYDQVHGRSAWRKDNVYRLPAGLAGATDDIAARLKHAEVDISAILDFASSFGTIVLSRAYADWSIGVNASYQGQLMERAVDLTQLFPTAHSLKNGADIRLAVDVIEDSFRLKGLTHVIIVAGDSDYIPLAQRCKRLDRYVVGIGVSGSTSTALAAACDEYADYDALPGVGPDPADSPVYYASAATAKMDAPATASQASPTNGVSEPTASADPDEKPPKTATALLKRALELLAKNDLDWQHASAVKVQMKRMDPSFQERPLGYSQFSEFLRSRQSIIEIDKNSPTPLRVRLRG